MEAYQERVIEEKKQLDERLERLVRFINDNEAFATLPRQEQDMLTEQLRYMAKYRDVLGLRIKRFEM